MLLKLTASILHIMTKTMTYTHLLWGKGKIRIDTGLWCLKLVWDTMELKDLWLSTDSVTLMAERLKNTGQV